MLTIWSAAKPMKVLRHLEPVLKAVPALDVTVVSNFAIPPKTTTILALGTVSLKYLQDAKLVHKNRTLTSYRTQPIPLNGHPVLVSYSPDIGEIDHSHYIDLLTDTSLAVRHALTGQWLPQYGTYRYVPDFRDLCQTIETQYQKTGKPVDVNADLETLGLDPYALPTVTPPFPGAYIVTMQATCAAGTADVVRLTSREHEAETFHTPNFLQYVEFLLRSPRVRVKGANFKYDLHWLWKRSGLTCTNFIFDTTIVGSLLDENRSNALDVHTKIYVHAMGGYSDRFDRTVDKSRMDRVAPDALLPYAGGDVDAGFQVAEVQKRILVRDSALAGFYVNILHPASRAFEQLEQGGVVVDLQAYHQLKADLEAEHLRLVKEACKIVGGRIVAKHRDPSRPGQMNLTKASMLRDFLFDPHLGLGLKPKEYTEKPDKDGIKRPSTAMAHLEMLADVPKARAFIELVREDSKIMKIHDTYVVGFLEHLRSDGRFHSNYFLYAGNRDSDDDSGGTNTGRLSAKDPAWQTLPQRGKWAQPLRRCFPAPPGYVVLSLDYSQGELRIIACVAHESTMIQIYREGRDLHTETAAVRWKMSYEELKALEETNPQLYEEKRYPGKSGNFGLCLSYGQRVLTHVGLVPIEEVKDWYLVWDGVDWVQHDGVIFRGYKSVMTYDGLTATPDHQVWTEEGWQISLGRAASEGRALARTGDADRPIAITWVDNSQAHIQAGRQVSNDRSCVSVLSAAEGLSTGQSAEWQDDAVCMSTQPQIWWRSTCRNAWQALRRYGAAVYQRFTRVIASVQRAWDRVPVPILRTVYSVGIADVSGFRFQGTGLRSKEQRWSLRARQSQAGYSQRQFAEQIVPVYDILNAGPRRRFTCEGRLVSNCYGMGVEGFIAYAQNNYGVTLTWDEANDFREGFFKKYPRLRPWHDEYKKRAHKDKQVRSPLGRVRHLPLIDSPNQQYRAKEERRAVNSPIQGCLSDMMLWALAIGHQQGLQSIAPAFGMTHDSASYYVPEDQVDVIVNRYLDIMENLPFEKVNWAPPLKFVADAKVGKTLGDLKKYKR
ncbi:MAG: hypothetical protein C5B54_10185 [Acidobacteria bacterium]|nr:MAG: hypothetical protein C5B54_10185 [Acidobacteriota bacterium]